MTKEEKHNNEKKENYLKTLIKIVKECKKIVKNNFKIGSKQL